MFVDVGVCVDLGMEAELNRGCGGGGRDKSGRRWGTEGGPHVVIVRVGGGRVSRDASSEAGEDVCGGGAGSGVWWGLTGE